MSIFLKSVHRILAVALVATAACNVHAQSQAPFPITLNRVAPNGACTGLTANRLSVDPASGGVTLEGVNNLTCLPDGAAGLGNVVVSVPAGPFASGATVEATVQNIPVGATCTIRGTVDVQGSGVVGGQGWASDTLLCSSCAATASRSLVLTNFSTSVAWNVRFRAQCSITSGGYSVAAPEIQSQIVTVQPGTIAVGSCPYQGTGGDQVPPGHDGITIANRQNVSFSSYGFPGGSSGNRDVTSWVGLNGAWPSSTPPLGGTVAQGFGFPGAWFNNTNFFMQRGRFIALKFRAPLDPGWYGRYSQYSRYSYAGQPNTGPYSMSVSKCPGQFREAPGAELPSRCLEGPSAKNGVEWIIVNPNVPYTGSRCALKAGETYYFNLFAADPDGDLNDSLCPGANCEYKVGSQTIFQ